MTARHGTASPDLDPAARVRRISIWSGPRNVSTALMYAFRERSDTVVFDEPLYGHYLRATGAAHPGRDDVLAAMDTDGARVVREVLLGGSEADARPVRVYKNMAHHLRGLERSFLPRLTNAILTRDPVEMLPSLAQQIPYPRLADTGLVEQVELLEVELAAGRDPVVIDARRLLEDPEGVLREACAALGLPFQAAMLTWEAGPKPEDGVWAPHWYANVHRSTGFEPYRGKDREAFPARLEPLLAQCRPLYARLSKHAIGASDAG